MEDRLSKLSKAAIEFRDARDWKQFHTPKNLAEAISVESGELLEHFLWGGPETESDNQKIEAIAEEIADIAIFTIYLCNSLGIDLADAVERKLVINGVKYPVSKSKGSSKKYTELS